MTFGTRISDTLFAAGQPTEEQLRQFCAAGLRRVIDLRPSTEDHGFDEPTTAVLEGLEYHSLPIASEQDLSSANVQTLDLWLSGPHPMTLIHCGSGNRAGALLALRAGWLHGASAATALEIGRTAGLKGLEPAVRALLARQIP